MKELGGEVHLPVTVFHGLPRTVALLGNGTTVTLLHDVGWLRSCRLIYWGDMDDTGFNILSRFLEEIEVQAALLAPRFEVAVIPGTLRAAFGRPCLRRACNRRCANYASCINRQAQSHQPCVGENKAGGIIRSLARTGRAGVGIEGQKVTDVFKGRERELSPAWKTHSPGGSVQVFAVGSHVCKSAVFTCIETVFVSPGSRNTLP